MVLDDANTLEEIGDDPDNFEGTEDINEDSPEERNVNMAYYDPDNPAYDDTDDSNPTDELAEGFQEGVESDEKPSDDWVDDEE